ncbi:hypothetical protein AVEN_272222-1 [Araneus ventricosus]|uniref:Uncharacterized protein n=1 Tax=Araneus ventricosus TaxID=182803 RepID=A0A4Y2SHM6_ARAVE|nr:hypothetical protein AVEN_272222-1 [Araneus ventricosus]
MNFPERHDLARYDGEFEFEGSGFCPQQWEISVRQRHCIIWSVILSYLKSANFTIPGQFESRLNQLTGNEVDSELAKDAIQDFNPFFNIHKCFFNETLQNICANFRKRLNGEQKRRKACEALHLISSMLNIKILIVDLRDKKLNVIEPEESSSSNVDLNDKKLNEIQIEGHSSSNLDRITLIFKEYTTEQDGKPRILKRFNFSLDEGLCCELRKDALEIILETSEIKTLAEEEILPMLNRGEIDINFVITLLKKHFVGPVSSLYESWYVAGKLSDAGFETDPRVLDTRGFSAFYYALQSNDSNLVYILYRYAANSCYESESTFRDPNPCIISNFSKLKEILSGDCARSNNFEDFGDRAEQARVTYQDLLRFNEFLSQVTCGINEIRKRQEVGSLEEAAKQKQIILLILDTYIAFFSVGQLDSQQELIENYAKHKTYYDNLDLTVALLFFDNIFLLKSVLKFPGEHLYSELESSFLLSAVTNKYLTADAKNRKNLEDLGFELDSINLSIIPLLERLNLRESVTDFCNIIRSKRQAEEEIVDCIPPEEITEMLSSFPQLKDEVLIFRLNHYLLAVNKTSEAKDSGSVSEDMKEKFVIQRALQVIGESINVEEADPSSIRHLLCKCLPKNTLAILKKTRNTLSHLRSFQFPLKFDTEEDDGLFTSIRSEIQNIKDAFQNVFDIQRILLIEFLINRGLKSVQKFQEDAGIDMHPLEQPMKNFGDELRKRSTELKCMLDRMGTDGNRVLVPNINEFHRLLMGFASKTVKEEIHGEIPLEVRTRIDDNEILLEDLEKGIAVDVDRFDSLFLKTKDICNIQNKYEKYLQEESQPVPGQTSKRFSFLHRIKKSPNPLNTLHLIFEKNKVSDSQLNVLFEVIPFSDKAKSTLNSLIEICKCPCGDNLANLLNRIKHLYQMSVNEQYDILYLWERVKSFKAKQYLVYKIVQRYFRESSFQASLEMLLFDCVGILKNNEDLKYFWLKDSYLFNGIDVRNVLAHGDPLLESIGDILDPKDLPSELVKKMLQLFEDRECIEALCDLWQKAKLSDKIPDNSSDWHKLKERIVGCTRWQDFSKLLAEDPEDFETCDAVISFLNEKHEPKKKKGRNCNSESSGN